MKKQLTLLLAFIMALTTACGKPDTSLKGKEFTYQESPRDVTITLGFDATENRVYGSSGVNRYFGSYTQNGTELRFSPLASTMMAGPQKAMEAEQAYLKEMNDVVSFELKDRRLILKTKTNQELFFKQDQP